MAGHSGRCDVKGVRLFSTPEIRVVDSSAADWTSADDLSSHSNSQRRG